MRKVLIDMLTPEMRLGKSIYHEKFMLLRRGTANLHRYVNKFKEMDIGSIYIDDDLSDGIDIPDAIGEATRIKCKKVLADTFEWMIANNPARSLAERRRLTDVVNEMIAEIVSQPHIIISLQDIGSSKDETLLHSVNTTVYGLVLAQRVGVSEVSMRDLAQGLLLHDIGKIILQQEILYKSSALTLEEFEHIKLHTTLGYDILRKNPLLTEASRRVALDHHERIDGSGYAGRLGDDLNTLTRISMIADVYEALTVSRCYRKSYTPSKAADIMMADAVDKLDADLLAQFFQCVAIYPNGSMLQLSDGRFAIVKEQSHGVPFRPIVRLLVQKNGKQEAGEEIDLSKTLNITVIEDDPDLISKMMANI